MYDDVQLNTSNDSTAGMNAVDHQLAEKILIIRHTFS